MQLSDSVFYKIARSVVFPVNKFDIPEDSEFYDELVHQVIPDMNARGYRLESVSIRGAASPEGPYSRNQFLGQRRLEALIDIIDRNMEEPSCPDCLKKNDIPEDYNYLLYMMAERGDEDYERVKTHVDRYLNVNIEVLKQRLMSLDGGALWKRLLKQYFPALRAARVVLFFRKPAAPEEPIVEIDEPIAEIDEPIIEIEEPIAKIEEPIIEINEPIAEIEEVASPVAPVIEPILPLHIDTIPERIPRRELLSLKTNLLLDFAYMPFGYKAFCPIPNVAIEYYPLHGHFTYGAMFDCPWWSGGITDHKYFQARNYTLESRYYFRSGDAEKRPAGSGAAFRGWYMSAYANAALYGIGWADKNGQPTAGTLDGHGWMGEGLGGGFGLGYVVPLSRNQHWRLELSATFGVFATKYDRYVYGCPVENVKDGLYYYDYTGDADLFKRREYRLTWLGPTRVSINLSYDLMYRKNHRRGLSFRSNE